MTIVVLNAEILFALAILFGTRKFYSLAVVGGAFFGIAAPNFSVLHPNQLYLYASTLGPVPWISPIALHCVLLVETDHGRAQ